MPILNPNYSNLNHDEMASAIGLKVKHIPMLIGSFLEESELIMNNLEEAIQKKDFSQIKSHAHSIKGSAGNLKFDAIYEMAKEIELSAATEDNSFDYKTYFEAIKTAITTIPS